MDERLPALAIIFVFTFIPLWIGELSKKSSLDNVEDFFLHSRKMPLPVLFLTVYATWWSSFAFLGSTSYFYSKGPIYLTAIAWNILFGVLFYLIGKRIWFYGKSQKFVTPTDFFSYFYNHKYLNMAVTATMLLFTILYLQIQLAGGAYLIEVASGGIIPWWVSGLIFYLVIAIYLWSGGLRAVAWADIFYSFLIFFGMIISGLYLSHKAGGIGYLFHQVEEIDPFYLILPGPGGNSGILLWVCMFVMTPVGAIMGPQMWIRMYASASHKAFSIMPFLLSLTAIAYIGSALAGYSAIILEPDFNKPDMVLPTMLIKYAPPWLGAFLFCCGAAAALSTANSQIHAISAVYSIDIHRRYFDKRITEKSLAYVGKWSVIVFSTYAYLILIQSPSLIVTTGLVALSGTAQVFVPVLGALFWKRSSAAGAFAGLLTGLATMLTCTYIYHLASAYGGALGLLLNAAVFIVVSLLLRKDSTISAKIVALRQSYKSKHLKN
jgi:SSS family solute:Na+ symporter